MTLKIPFQFPMNQQAKENLTSNLGFVDENIQAFRVNDAEECVEVELSNDSASDIVKEKVTKLMDKLKPMVEFEPKVIFDNMSQQVPCTDDVFTKLLDDGSLSELSPGIFAISGLPMQMMMALNNKVIEFATTLGAEEVLYPVLNPIQDLKEAAFFKRTPQHANFVSLLSKDSDKITDFVKLIENESNREIFDYFNTPTHICRSAICSNSYPTYRDKVFDDDSLICLTTLGRAFRNESKNVQSLERVHEFSMREVIFFGNKENVTSGLEKCIDWFKELMTGLGLKGVIQTAGDPFYADNITALQFYQFAEQSKLEVRLKNPYTDNEISCGSINNHGHHFAKSYNIKLKSGEFATSGCVGWGFERTVFLVLSQYGLNQDNWPQAIRNFFSQN